MSEPYLGQIMMFGGNFAPSGWATCDGQLLAISQNTALFAILGTTFGGNGVSTFGLPDLRGRVPVHWGQGLGLSVYTIGEVVGVESVSLISTQMPQHTHPATVTINATESTQSATTDPAGAIPAGGSGQNIYATGNSDGTKMGTGMATAVIAPAGGSQPHENRQPLLCITFCIALVGVFPSRN
jgi:microcystin-dependent protein